MSALSIPASRPRFVGIFIVALVVIAYQVLLTRILSVTMYYHFAFAGISLAMLGMTIGAEKVYLKTERFVPARFTEEWARAALNFGISAVLLVVWFLCVPLLIQSGITMMLLAFSMLLFIIPFTYSGICVTLVLTQSAEVGKLYAADLIGAALGCVGIVALMFFLDPVTILFLLGALCAYAAWYMVRGTGSKYERKSKAVMALMLVCALVQGALCVSNNAHLGVFWAKGKAQQNLLYERWNTFSRVRVVHWDKTEPYGWGFGHEPVGQNLEQDYIDIDADAGTMISKFDGDLKPFKFLSEDIINTAYSVRPVSSVAVIGVGGGRDVLSALYFGVKNIVAIELNPSIAEVLKQKFADFAGHILERPEVQFVNAEARSWIAQHKPPVDMVQISLIDTWAATAAGGLTLTENRLYTLEAWKEFLSTLTPKGMLEVSRWYDAKTYKGEYYRLLALATDSLKAIGVPASDVRQHIFAFQVNRIVTVVLSPTGFTPEEVANAHNVAKEKGYNLLVAPDVTSDDIAGTIVSGEATQAYYDSLPLDVAASTDNRPFFFFTTRLSELLKNHGEIGSVLLISSNVALLSVSILFLGTIIVTLGFVIQPLVKVAGRLPFKDVTTDLAYFAGIGIGFMLIEISQMQRLMVFLGHPVFGLSVVLFTLLLFGGIGSATVHPDVRPMRLWKRPMILCLVLIAIGLATPVVTSQFVSTGTIARILVSIVLLAPAGLFMGMMFPAGMILSARHRELQPWFWGINGSFSVFASILGMVISMSWGISAAYWCGVAAYVVCFAIAFQKRHAAA